MDVPTLVVLGASGCSFFFIFRAMVEDQAARANARKDASPASFLIRPLHLFNADLYTEVGERHRRAALKALAGFLGCGLVAVVFSILGGL